MSVVTVRIPDTMDHALRAAAAAADAPSLNAYIVQAVRRQMTLDAARKLVALDAQALDLDGEGDAL